MDTLFQNKRKLQYVLFTEPKSVYLTDENGNIVNEQVGDQVVPVEIGKTNGYEEPVEFSGNISYKSGEGRDESFGVSPQQYDFTLTMMDGEIPISETSLIFYTSDPEYDDNGDLKPESADFRVIKVAPYLNHVVYLLKQIVH